MSLMAVHLPYELTGERVMMVCVFVCVRVERMDSEE